MTATTPPITQTRFGVPFGSGPGPCLGPAPEVRALADSTLDETDVPDSPTAWSLRADSDEQRPLSLTLTRAALVTEVDDDAIDGQDENGGWQPLGEHVRLASGRRVPGTRYRIVRWLGEGGMGVVFEALHVDIQRSVALKILKPGIAGSDLQRDRFIEEARAVASVDSRFVVDVLDFGELPDGRPFYTMELLDPVSLADELRGGPLPIERVLPILRQCCKALAAVHERGMAHRDVKPQNLLIQREDGRTDVVRIVDFGIAAKFGSQPRIAGTAMYMAPEQIRGIEFDGRLDVYGLGCVAHELLTGAPPFDGANAAEVVQHHLHDEAPAISNLPPQLDAVVRRCLSKQPSQRFASMHELEAALCEVQIAAGFTTAWDDLPLPAVSESQRTDLRRRMPQPRAERRRLGSGLRLLFGALAVGLISAGALLAIEPAPTRSIGGQLEFDSARQAIVETTEAARVAGSRAYWAYPPATEPEYPTALRMITTLEQEPGPLRQLARAEAAQLRDEFAETLVRLGDQYWSAPHGRPFAVEYYAQALLFDPEQVRALERAQLTPAQIHDLATRVAVGELTPIEIDLAEALRVLADQDLVRRRERVAALIVEGAAMTSSIRFREQLGAAVGLTSESRPLEPSDPMNSSDPVPTMSATEKPTAKPVALDPAAASRQAHSYVTKAKAALARGDRDRAERLFEKALVHAPKLADAHAGLAEIHFARGRYQEAMSAARRAARARPNDADLQLLLGDACVKSLRYDDARQAYTKARALGHDKATARLLQLDEVNR